MLNSIQCSGCGACAVVCPRNCIAMTADEAGFLYPQVDESRCVTCGLCEKTCPIGKQSECGQTPLAFAVINQEVAIRKESTSGGVFTLVARQVLQNGGSVFGAAVTEGLKIVHVGVTREKDLHRLRGAKYVQSDVGNTYTLARQRLEEGKQVLYTGTPCQIAGLKAYLGKEYENLICQDVICHGTPSPEAWRKYVDQRQRQAGAKVTAVSFRYKSPEWADYSLRMTFENGKVYQIPMDQDPYLRAFLHDLSLRAGCYNCAFKGVHREADLTLADFWGVWDVLPDMDDHRGTSLVLVHSEKGREVLENIRPLTQCREVDCKTALEYNPSMLRSPTMPESREKFFAGIRENDFDGVVNILVPPPGLKTRLVKKGKRMLKRLLRR